jgi:hypothetical protein
VNFLPSGLFGNLLSFQWLKRFNDRYPMNWSALYGAVKFNKYGQDWEKVAMAFSNPAFLKVIVLQCDLFSMGKIVVKDKDGNEIEDDPFLTLAANPNLFQGQAQFLWDYMFWTMVLGNARCYVDSKVVSDKNRMYFLEPYKIVWPEAFQKNADKLLFGGETLKEMGKMDITYRYQDGSTIKFPADRLVNSFDLTNGIGNWLQSPSRVDALYKVISNSEHALDAKNINVRYTGKFLVGSQSEVGKTPMSEEEKTDIEEKVDDLGKRVWAVRSQVNIRRFIENLSQQKLDEAFLADYFLIGTMYGIPRDVLEAYTSATYENQEKARAAHVDYCLSPKGEQFMDSFEKHFNYVAEGKNICISWTHLPFMQVFEKTRNEVEKIEADTAALTIKNFQALVAMGVSIDDANAYLETDFVISKQPAPQPAPTV